MDQLREALRSRDTGLLDLQLATPSQPKPARVSSEGQMMILRIFIVAASMSKSWLASCSEIHRQPGLAYESEMLWRPEMPSPVASLIGPTFHAYH